MIRPDRHTNPDFSVINISALILKQLNAFYAVSYDSLSKKVIDTLGEESKENYPYALNFLFLLGKLNYQQETDSFTLNHETK
jgi:hypothetical protein